MKTRKSIQLLTMLLMCFLLCACTNEIKKGDYLYLAINNSNINKMDKYPPTKISVYYSDMVAWTSFTESKDIDEFIAYFKDIVIEEEAEPITQVDISCIFVFEEEEIAIYTNKNVVQIKQGNEKAKYYKISGIEKLKEFIEKKSISSYGYGDEKEREVLNYDNVTIVQKPIEKDDYDDFVIRFQVSNNSSAIYDFIINPIVNDHKVHSYEDNKVMQGETLNFEAVIPASVFNKYGVSEIGRISYTIDVYECDENTKEVKKYVTSSDLIEALNTNDVYSNEIITSEDTIVYMNNGVKMHSILIEDGINSAVYVYIVNENEEKAYIYYTGSVLNGEPFVTSVNPKAYSIEVDPKSDVIAKIPLMSYSIDPSTKIVKEIDINNLSMTFDMLIGDVVITEQKVIIK